MVAIRAFLPLAIQLTALVYRVILPVLSVIQFLPLVAAPITLRQLTAPIAFHRIHLPVFIHLPVHFIPAAIQAIVTTVIQDTKKRILLFNLGCLYKGSFFYSSNLKAAQ